MPAGVSYMTQRAFFMEKMKNEERKKCWVYGCIFMHIIFAGEPEKNTKNKHCIF